MVGAGDVAGQVAWPHPAGLKKYAKGPASARPGSPSAPTSSQFMVVRFERSGTISFRAVPDACTTELTRAAGLSAGCFARRTLVEQPSFALPMVEVMAAIAAADPQSSLPLR